MVISDVVVFNAVDIWKIQEFVSDTKKTYFLYQKHTDQLAPLSVIGFDVDVLIQGHCFV